MKINLKEYICQFVGILVDNPIECHPPGSEHGATCFNLTSHQQFMEGFRYSHIEPAADQIISHLHNISQRGMEL